MDIGQFKSSLEEMDLENISEPFNIEDIYQNKELKAEIMRRGRFNFYWHLKTGGVNASISKKVFSFRHNEFIGHDHVNVDWQLRLFGGSRPYILRAINPDLKTHFQEVANGYLGISGFSGIVQMQSLFSGSFMETHRASIPSWSIRNISSIHDINDHNIVIGRRSQLDMSNGRFSQIIFSEHCIVEQQIYVHQIIKSLIVHEIEVQFMNSSLNAIVLNLPEDRTKDLSSNMDIIDESDDTQTFRIISGVTHTNDLKEHEQRIHAFYHPIPDKISVSRSDRVIKYYFLMSINENKETSLQHLEKGISLMEDNNKLFAEHDSIWRDIWSNTAVFMRRSHSLDIPLLSAQYLINSNLPSIGSIQEFGALGATGLGVQSNMDGAHNLDTNCGGRIEFSQELWMVNAQVFLHPDSVRSIIKKRILQMPMARNIATYFDFSGAKYPAFTNEQGEDLCKDHILCQDIIFPSGIIAQLLNKFLLVTGDQSMFTNDTGLGLLKEINEFWKSVLKRKSLYKALKSVPISNLKLTVNNSVFDIGLIKEGLLIVPTLIDFFNITPDKRFAEYLLDLHKLSESINVPYNNIRNCHLPHTGFDPSRDMTSIPEGVMLRYPLDHLVDVDTSGSNLRFYENRLILPLSPMTLSTLLINNIDADRFPEAEKNFINLIKFCDNTFQIWTKGSNLWQGSYIPAASSYLDSILFGMLGIRIRRSGLYLYPKLISDISYIEVTNLEYLGSTIKVMVHKSKGIFLQVLSTKPNALNLGAMDYISKISKVLDRRVHFPLGTFLVIKRLKSKS